MIAADPGSVGEGITISLRREHLFTPRAFTSLKVNQAIVKLFDGVRVLEPWVVYLKPMHENPEVSWFDTTGRVVAEPAAEHSRPRFRRLRGFWRVLTAAPRCLWRRRAVPGRPVAASPQSQAPPPSEETGQTTQDDSHGPHP